MVGNVLLDLHHIVDDVALVMHGRHVRRILPLPVHDELVLRQHTLMLAHCRTSMRFSSASPKMHSSTADTTPKKERELLLPWLQQISYAVRPVFE